MEERGKRNLAKTVRQSVFPLKAYSLVAGLQSEKRKEDKKNNVEVGKG